MILWFLNEIGCDVVNKVIKSMYAIIGILMIIVLIIVNLQFVNAGKILREESMTNAQLSLQIIHNELVQWMHSKGKVIQNTKAYIEKNLDNEQGIETFLVHQRTVDTDFLYVLYAEADSTLTDESWYKLTALQGSLTVTEPYLNSENIRVITIADPIYSESGELKGVIAGEIPIEKIDALFVKTEQAMEEIFYIVSDRDKVIYTNSAQGSDETLTQFNLWYEDANDARHADTFEMMPVSFDDREGYYHYHEFDYSDWRIMSYLPIETFSGAHQQFLYITFALSGLIILAFYSLFLLQKHMISTPLLELGTQIDYIDVEREDAFFIQLSSSKSFNTLADKINALLKTTYSLFGSINEDREELQALNEELEASFSQLVATEQEITRQKMHFESLFRNAHDAIAMFDHEHKILDTNKAFEDLFGFRLSEILGLDLDDILALNHKTRESTQLTQKVFNGQLVTAEGIRYKKDKSPVHVSIQGVPMLIEGFIIGGYGIYTDISDRKEKEAYLTYVSTHDDLTQVYNRPYFEQKLKSLNQAQLLPIGVMMVDVNGLKVINDAFGHTAGDDVLRIVAKRIQSCTQDSAVIARLGGDEFGILISNLKPNGLELLSKSIKDACKGIFVEGVEITIAVGWEEKHLLAEDIKATLKQAEDFMNRNKLLKAHSLRGKSVYAIINTLHEKNKREEAHSKRVGELSYRLGTVMGVSSVDLDDLKTMGLLHDIGKIAIDAHILNKPDRLTHEEFEEIKKHPEIGYRILSAVNELSEVAEYVLAHHEHWNGMGYPRGLKGDEIPYLSRIIGIVDAYDAMTSDRTYRKAMHAEEALEELKRFSGIQFDPELVTAFVSRIEEIDINYNKHQNVT